MTATDKFYEHLDGFTEFSQFTQLNWYRPLPSSWFVLITDVKGSTVAPLKVPYVFGSDGATMCIPPSSKAAAESAMIVFGIHDSAKALMTCLVFNHENDHIHFLDVADGGYALAVKDMKHQLSEL